MKVYIILRNSTIIAACSTIEKAQQKLDMEREDYFLLLRKRRNYAYSYKKYKSEYFWQIKEIELDTLNT